MSLKKGIHTTSFIVLVIILGFGSGALGAFLVLELSQPSQHELIKDFYDIENAVHVSPHSLRKSMTEGKENFVLVDLRSKQEYDVEHIAGAVSIPAYSDPNTSAYGDVDRIVGSFRELQANNPGKDIIVYCYSIPCMTGRKVGKMLAENDIYVKHLGIGWNEWRYYWTLWNHQPEWGSIEVEDYVVKGPLPGKANVTGNASGTCPISGSLGC